MFISCLTSFVIEDYFDGIERDSTKSMMKMIELISGASKQGKLVTPSHIPF